MNETTNLNSQLLSADARGRKHIPFAVFAVIVIHIVLFLILLIAAGCRAKARARQNAKPASETLAQSPATFIPATVPLLSTNAGPKLIAPAAAVITPGLLQPVVATEPPIENRGTPPATRKAAQKSSPANGQRPTAKNVAKAKVYVVKAGDTVEKIAKMHGTSVQTIKAENNLKDHLLHPGQQLRVGSQKNKPSTEA